MEHIWYVPEKLAYDYNDDARVIVFNFGFALMSLNKVVSIIVSITSKVDQLTSNWIGKNSYN